MSEPAVQQWLSAHPRVALGHWPTPLVPLDRLSEELAGPRIWLKRDDCSGLAMGGNKTRKLEFLLGEALAADHDAVVTFGAVQSNHARQTAAGCAVAGLPCHLILHRQVQPHAANYETSGNVLLDELFNATVHFIDPDAPDDAARLLDELRTRHRLAVIPAGGSNATGALGYVACAAELQQQCVDNAITLSHVVHASSSAGTQAGLLCGFGALGLKPRVLGVNVYHDDPATLHASIDRLIEKMHAAGAPHARASNPATEVNHAYIGAGYGQPGRDTIDAIRMAAQIEGVLFDPVYSGKALSALIDQITVGAFDDASDVILIHTGGTPALFVYEAALSGKKP